MFENKVGGSAFQVINLVVFLLYILGTFTPSDCPKRVGAGEDAISQVETVVHDDNLEHEVGRGSWRVL